jgi:hypothetical protein
MSLVDYSSKTRRIKRLGRKTRRAGRKQRGGMEIGRGRYGYVYRPALKCSRKAGMTGPNYGEEYVSKIFLTENNADDGLYREYANGLLVKALDPSGNWSLTPEILCPLDKTQENTGFLMRNPSKFANQIIYKYGGVTLESLVTRIGERDEYTAEGPDLRKYTIEGFKLYVGLVKRLMTILPKLHVKYVHTDLHNWNILFSTEDDGLRLIDFGRLESIEANVAKLKAKMVLPNDEIYIDIVKQVDYKNVYDSVSSLVWDFGQKQSLPGFFDEWLDAWHDKTIWRASQNKTLTCQMYVDAINALPDLA